MRISQVCIERPVLASVMSLGIVLFGAIGLLRLQNRELPDVDPPKVTVTTVYPGAAPEVVETSVTQPLEDAVNGIEGVKHVTSLSREQVSQITIEFDLGRELEAAANDVRDRVARTRSQLPDDIDDPIVAKQDSDANAVVWLALYGEGWDQIRLTTLAETRLKDRLAKLPGVASIIVGGERRYSMRIWIENRRLGAHGLAIADVVEALRRENVDIPSGRVESADTEFTVRSLGELRRPEEYENLILANVNGSPVRLRDVAEVEVGPESERKLVRYNGVPAVGLGVIKQSQANTLDVADAVREEVRRVQDELPEGVVFEVAFDSSAFIRDSIRDVTRTIFEAALLVVLVIYVFLRTVRATIVPAVAIPVSIVGAFALLYFFGFTINTLTLMGITLAIGLVVDDAIVVLENVSRWVEEGTPPMEAARRGMQEISFAVVAATVSAVAVFVPLTFLTDTTGRLFREFAVTVAAAIAISGFVAVTLSPALCARVLRERRPETGVKRLLAVGFERLSRGYDRALGPVLARPWLFVAIGAVWVVAGFALLRAVDEELIPQSDRGVVLAWTVAPEGSTVDYMNRYQKQAEDVVLADPNVARLFSVVALGLGTPGLVNEGLLIATLLPESERTGDIDHVMHELGDSLREVPGIQVFPFLPAPLRGFTSAPVELTLQGPDVFELARMADEIEQRATDEGGFTRVRSNLFLNKPQLDVVIDREKASDLGVSVREIATALQILLGGVDISTFKLDGETYNVMAQLRRPERSSARDLASLAVRGNAGLIPLWSIVDARETVAPRALPHYDRFRSVTLTSELEGLAQGEALDRIEGIAESVIPPSGPYRVRFSGEAERFFESGNALVFAYGLALLVVYLVLAAQFESFVHPFTIMVAVALSFTGALVALWATQTTLNLFSKIGLVMLVGLVTKNSILIVEFANQLRDRGLGVAEATARAARTRFRPILMTALATMVGILPIALGLGAGGESRAPLGVAVVGGVFFSTILTFFVVPATYLTIERARERARARRSARDAAHDSEPVAARGS